MMKRWVVGGIGAVLMSAGLLACSRNAGAEQPAKAGKVVLSDVIISGNQRMSIEQIKTRLRTQAGSEYDPAIVDDDVRQLYKTGQFSNITTLLQSDGIDRAKIYISVCEMPNKVQKVSFQGAKHIKTEDLYSITGVRPSTPLNPELNSQGCQKIRDKYAEIGRPFTDCRLIKGGDWDDTEVVYQIAEGPKVKVSDIEILGNRFANSARLRQKVVLQGGDAYRRKSAEAGIDELYSFYRDLGFQDVRISLEVQRNSTPGEVVLIYHIHEGPRYRNAVDSQK